jgi:succinate dehydrogenase hydrophobic anchor subunit
MKEGAKHWLWERVTAVALIPLSLWFLASIRWPCTPCVPGSAIEEARPAD